MKAAIAKYATSDLRWVQDEPANQGPWTYMGLFMPRYGINFKVISRPASASPATGSSKRHAAEQADVIARAFAD
jgi:2-oxoglutarate dehydrogenase E1 component